MHDHHQEDATMMLIKDLADRWGVTLSQAKKIVRAERVPFVALRRHEMKTDWRFVRFEPEAVAAWEQGRVEVYKGKPAPAALPPRSVVMRKLR